MKQLDEVIEALEIERMRLAACGVVASANTPQSAKIAREMKDEYKSASLDDVIKAVDKQMEYRMALCRIRTRFHHIPEVFAFVNELMEGLK